MTSRGAARMEISELRNHGVRVDYDRCGAPCSLVDTETLIASMKPGQSLAYHRGFLIDDRKRNGPLAAMSLALYRAARPDNPNWEKKPAKDDAALLPRGSVVQYRLGDCDYLYVFRKSKR